jgi:hypothetical protein
MQDEAIVGFVIIYVVLVVFLLACFEPHGASKCAIACVVCFVLPLLPVMMPMGFACASYQKRKDRLEREAAAAESRKADRARRAKREQQPQVVLFLLGAKCEDSPVKRFVEHDLYDPDLVGEIVSCLSTDSSVYPGLYRSSSPFRVFRYIR